MSARSAVVLSLLAGLLLSGCGQRDDVRARYELERRLWQAQLIERRININFVRASQGDIARAIDAFSAVVDSDPLSAPGASDWDEAIVADIRRMQLTSTIALANLYFLAQRYREASSVYTRSLEADVDFQTGLDARLGVARSLYLTGDEGALEAQCRRLFDDMAGRDDFWSGTGKVPEVFMNVPVILVRLYRDRGERARMLETAERARAFYGRVVQTWPEESIAVAALQAELGLEMVLERWQAAIALLERMEADDRFEGSGGQLTLLRGEIIGRQPGGKNQARAVFEGLLRDRSDGAEAYGARYNLAVFDVEGGDVEAGLAALRALEQDKATPPDIAARAMLTHALYLERDGQWDEALPILRRLIRLYPHTQPSIEAPLVITRHYLRAGESALAQRSLERATEYYLSLLERNSSFRGNRLFVADLLVENYVEAGEADAAARLLEDAPGRWDDATTVGGLFRSAQLYADVLGDSNEAQRILEKCIEKFPETRYAKIAQQQLQRLRAESGTRTH